MIGFRVLEFRPLAIHLADVGPFQGRIESVDFTDRDGEPCNFFLLLSQNGRGKTTILEAMAHLVGLLDGSAADDPAISPARPPEWLEDHPRARLQMDVLLRWEPEGPTRTDVLSLLAGGVDDPLIQPWGDTRLREAGFSAWHRFGYGRGPGGILRPIGDGDSQIAELRAFLAAAKGRSPAGFEEPAEAAPTLLYFGANRDIVRPTSPALRSIARPRGWGHRVVHRFEADCPRWEESTDCLVVWLHWMDDTKALFQRACDLVNRRVFRGTPKFLKGVRKDPPEAVVSNSGSEHRLDQLSSGERSLVEILIRLGSSMTRNTVLLVDELDLHLHPRWQHRAVRVLKELLREHPGLTAVVTSQSSDVLRAFAPEVPEEGLRKGGHILEEGCRSTGEESDG
jgi:ABC-type branched-subunit amino acid transport system ATPase component